MIFLLPSAHQSIITVLPLIKSFKTNKRLYKLNIKNDEILKWLGT